MHRSVCVLAALLLTTTALAQSSAKEWRKLRLQHVKPTSMVRMLKQGIWWQATPVQLPAQVDPPIAYDVDGSLLVRATAEGFEALNKMLAVLDAPGPPVRLTIRYGRVAFPNGTDGKKVLASAATTRELATRNDEPVALPIGPPYVPEGLRDFAVYPSRARSMQVRFTPHIHEDGSIALLAEKGIVDDIGAWSSIYKMSPLQALTKEPPVVNRGEKALFVLPIEEGPHRGEFYMIEVSARIVTPQ